ncbi:Major facilitator superfamily domain containing protein [Hyaloscypha variabilis]
MWSALATSYESFLGARALGGIGAAPNESIMTMVVADVFFLHGRGAYVGIYFWCYFMGLFVGPIISGSIAAHVSWRWFFWACTIAQSVNILFMAALLPESRRPRSMQQTLPIPSPYTSSDINEEEKDSATQIEAATTAGGEIILTDAYLGRGYPNLSQFNPFQPLDRAAFQTVLHHILTPVQLFFYPIVFWAAMSMGAAANALLAVNITQSQGLAAPPYNFTPGQVGFANFALVAGGVIGLLVAGPWSDWVIMAATKKNNGIREAETRLPALYPFIFAALIGLVVIGVGYDKHWPWEVIVILGFGLVGLQVVSIPTIAITYAIDCYTPVAGQIMVISTVCKNTFGFGQTYYYNNWATASGFTPPFMMIMALTVGFSLTGTILLPFFGKRLRVATRASKVHNF